MKNAFAEKFNKIKGKCKDFLEFDAPFVLVVFIMAAFIGISLCASASGHDHILCSGCSFNIAVMCQVVTTLICCIISVIPISFSLQNSEFLGIKSKDLMLLRTEKHFSYRAMVVMAIAFVSLSTAFCMLDWIIASLGTCVAAVLFCVYISFTEIPLMTKDEEAGIRILRRRILAREDATEVYARKLDEALKYLILEKNLATAFDVLAKQKTCGYDNLDAKRIMSRLLDVQENIAAEVKLIEERAQTERTINCIVGNIEDLVTFELDLGKIYGEGFVDTKHYVTRTLIAISQVAEGERKVGKLIREIIGFIDYFYHGKENTNKRDYVISILFSFCTESINRGNVSYIKEIKRAYSLNSFGIEQQKPSAQVFALFSMYLYALCEVEEDVSAKTKTSIKEAMKTLEAEYEYVSEPWDVLFQSFVANFSLDFNEFMAMYLQNERALQYTPVTGRIHWVAADQRFAIEWYLTALFCNGALRFDYKKLATDSNEIWRRYIESFKRKCFTENREFKETDDMVKMATFFGGGPQSFELFKVIESGNHAFFDFANNLEKEDRIEEAEEAKCVENKVLEDSYYSNIIKILQKERGFNSDLEIQEPQKKLKLLIYKSQKIINRDDAVVDGVVNGICSEIMKGILIKKCLSEEEAETEIEKIKAVNEKVLFVGGSNGFPSVSGKIDTEWINSLENVSSRILPYGTLVKEKAFMFNVEISLQVRTLSVEELTGHIEQFRRSDGQYIYEGVFYSREELEDYIYKSTALLDLTLSYGIKSDKDGIVNLNYIRNQIVHGKRDISSSKCK